MQCNLNIGKYTHTLVCIHIDLKKSVFLFILFLQWKNVRRYPNILNLVFPNILNSSIILGLIRQSGIRLSKQNGSFTGEVSFQ